MQRVSHVIPPMVDRQLRVPGEFLSQQTGTKYCTAQYYAQANNAYNAFLTSSVSPKFVLKA